MLKKCAIMHGRKSVNEPETPFIHYCKRFTHFFSDINECVRNTDNCHANAFCTNTEGSFLCTCLTGYAGNGVLCGGMYT